MSGERLRASGPVTGLVFACMRDRSSHMIRAMLCGNTAHLPQGGRGYLRPAPQRSSSKQMVIASTFEEVKTT